VRFTRSALVAAAVVAAAAPTASARPVQEPRVSTAADEPAPVVTLVRPQSTGFDWSSGLIGASVPLVLLVGGAVGAPAVARRRNRPTGLAS
jgi:hypothetical protein